MMSPTLNRSSATLLYQSVQWGRFMPGGLSNMFVKSADAFLSLHLQSLQRSAILHIELNNVLEIINRIIFDFYPLPRVFYSSLNHQAQSQT